MTGSGKKRKASEAKSRKASKAESCMAHSVDDLHRKFGKFGRNALQHVDDLWELALPPKGKVKGFAMKMMRLSAAEYELPKKSTDWVSSKFGMMDMYYGPPPFSEGRICFYSIDNQAKLCFDDFQVKIKLSQGRSGMLKLGYEEAALRKVIHEVCIQHHLEDLEGSRLAKMLFFGVYNSDEASPFFFIRELHEPILQPNQVSPTEFSELLSIVHAHGVLLNCEHYFPPLARVNSKLVLLDLSSAIFERKKAKFKEELEFLTGLCGVGV